MKKRMTYRATIILLLTTCFTIAVSSAFVSNQTLENNLRLLSMLIWLIGCSFMALTEHIWKR